MDISNTGFGINILTCNFLLSYAPCTFVNQVCFHLQYSHPSITEKKVQYIHKYTCTKSTIHTQVWHMKFSTQLVDKGCFQHSKREEFLQISLSFFPPNSRSLAKLANNTESSDCINSPIDFILAQEKENSALKWCL